MTVPDRVAFSLFGRDVYWYGVLMAIGIIIAVILASFEGKRKKLPKDSIIDLCLVVIPCGVVGARLFYVLCELDRYIDNPISMLYIWEGGLAIYGAVIGGLIGAFIYSRVKKIRLLRLMDCVAPGLVLAQAIGRWGNFFNQEAFGNPVTDPSMMWFPLCVKIEVAHTFNGVVCTNPYHLATFFYESMWCLLVFVLLWLVRKKFKHDGDALLTYFTLYSFERFFVESLRGDSLYLIQPSDGFVGLRISQVISAALFIGILIFFLIRTIKEHKTGKIMWPKPLAQADDDAENGTDENVGSDMKNDNVTENKCDAKDVSNEDKNVNNIADDDADKEECFCEHCDCESCVDEAVRSCEPAEDESKDKSKGEPKSGENEEN